MRLLTDPTVRVIVVEHRDRLARFGSEYIESALAASGRKLIVVDQTEMKDDLAWKFRWARCCRRGRFLGSAMRGFPAMPISMAAFGATASTGCCT
jgi:hypothetical protein